jgi:hypothetical protein
LPRLRSLTDDSVNINDSAYLYELAVLFEAYII